MSEDYGSEDYANKFRASLHALETTSGHKKIWQFLHDLESNGSAQKKIIELRKKFKIPEGGFDEQELIRRYGSQYRRWPERLRRIFHSLEFTREIEELYLSWGLDLMWGDIVHDYVLFNSSDLGSDGSMFWVSDQLEEKEDPYEENTQRLINQAHPVVLRISQYASQRDIIDFVKKMYVHQIAPIQKKYRNSQIKLGVLRKKKPSIQARNSFIYENRTLPKSELMKLVSQKFGEMLDPGHIGKIISLESKKRN